MLTPGDDFPVHQSALPLAYPAAERNFYDRYFFNGYTPDGEVFFAAALGVYPALEVMDAAFCVVRDGVQTNLRASRQQCPLDRLATAVGPIAVEVLSPLQRLRLRVTHESIAADLVFEGRAAVIAEPRYTRYQGARLMMDSTRMTQNGSWSGTVRVEGAELDMGAEVLGTRDRSWGIRPVGARDPQAAATGPGPQFFWLWAPCNFDDCLTHYHFNADAAGTPWSRHGVVAPAALTAGADQRVAPLVAREEHTDDVHAELELAPGRRHLARAEFTYRDAGQPPADETRVVLEPQYEFYMSGLGYGHPEWGHGMAHGDLEVALDTIELGSADPIAPLHLHVQAFSRATLYRGAEERRGAGILEQLMLGPYAPLGLTGAFDPP